jgi:multidrug efflux pump subunit AcrA (membrane-fusion protein)
MASAGAWGVVVIESDPARERTLELGEWGETATQVPWWLKKGDRVVAYLIVSVEDGVEVALR